MTNTNAIDSKMQKLLEKKQALAEQEKAIKEELRELAKRKSAADRKKRNKDMIVFATTFFQKSRLDYSNEYEAFVEYLEATNSYDLIVDDFRKWQLQNKGVSHE